MFLRNKAQKVVNCEELNREYTSCVSVSEIFYQVPKPFWFRILQKSSKRHLLL